MKPLPRTLSLTLLALTLTNCSGQLSSENIASRLESSTVKLFYRNQPGHGTGFFVPGETGVCTVLTAAHVVKGEGEKSLQTKDEKVWDVARVEIFPSDIDLALVTFEPAGEECNYPALKIGNSESLTRGSSIYISGFPIRGGKLVSQFVSGTVSGLDRLAQGYGVSYNALTVGGMSGAPVVDVKGEVVAVHGMSDVEVVESFASLQASLSEEQRQTFQQAVDRVNGVQRLTFSWGVPIRVFRESDFYYGDGSGLSLWVLWFGFVGGAMAGSSIVYFVLRHFYLPQLERQLEAKQNTQTWRQKKELERQLEIERQKRLEVEAELQRQQIEQNTQTQRQKELERQLWEIERQTRLPNGARWPFKVPPRNL